MSTGVGVATDKLIIRLRGAIMINTPDSRADLANVLLVELFNEVSTKVATGGGRLQSRAIERHSVHADGILLLWQNLCLLVARIS